LLFFPYLESDYRVLSAFFIAAAVSKAFAQTNERQKMCLVDKAVAELKAVENASELKLEPSATPRELKIIKLNDRVARITDERIAEAKKQKTELALEFVHSQQPMTALTAGAPVYVIRSAPLVYFYLSLGVILFLMGVSQLHPLVSLACIATMFLGYDIYSGILHVVLDHPSNIALPVLGQACFEFQWHHSIPDDLVRKDFVDVCGDLNVVIGIISAINLVLLRDFVLTSSVAHVLCGTKIFMAYFGQFSHRSAHSVGSRLSFAAKWLQKTGFMISTKNHMDHHQAPFDVDYCLIGVCNPIIDTMRKVTHSNTAWLALFFVWSIFDLYAYIHLIEMAAAYVAAV
jgi:hypothetical protein